MATYTQGTQPYLPNWQPFTPDYKFLSDVLDTKTNRYNTNYKELNDLYSRVVYSELSRTDTNQMRDQFSNSLGKQLELVSGMDLSLGENVDYAKQLFRPFYDEKIIVKDMLFTKKYRDDMQYANSLQQSPDEKMRELYWQTGVEALNYQMQDFRNASEEEALSMGLPQYVADADLEQRSLEYLKKQGFDVTMEYVSPEGMWIVKDRNGNLITEQAYKMASRALLDDPIVQQAYYTDAYVKSRKFADSAIESGKFKSVSEGQDAWANEVINVYEKNLKIRELKEKADLTKLQDINVNWDSYVKNYGIISGSDEDKQLTSVKDELAAKLMSYQQTQHVLQNASTMDTKSTKGLLNKAYSLIMGYNMQDDLAAGVTAFSNINKSREIKVNEYYKQKLDHAHDFAKLKQEFMYETLKEEQRQTNREKLEKLKNQLSGSGSGFFQNLFGPLLNPSGAVDNETGTEAVKIDPVTGEAVDPEDYDHISGEQAQILKYHQNAVNENLEFALQTLEKFYPNADNQYTLDFANTGSQALAITNSLTGGKKVGSLPELRAYLSDPKNISIAEGFIDNMRALVKDPILANQANPSFVKLNNGADLQQLQTKFDVANRKLDFVDNMQTQFMGIVSDNFDKAIQTDLTSETKREGESIAAGYPKIIQTSTDGSSRIISEAEFTKAFVAKAKAEGGPGKYYYFHSRPDSRGNFRMSRDGIGPGDLHGGTVTPDGYVFLEAYAESDAAKSYKNQKDIINGTLNGVLNTQAENGDKGKMFQTFDASSFIRGVPLDKMTPGDALKNPSYPSFIDPTTIGNDLQAQKNLTFLYRQIQKTPAQDLTFYWSDIGKANIDIKHFQSDKAKALVNQFFLDLAAFANNKASKTNMPRAKLTYNPVYGPNTEDGLGKTNAAYVIEFDTEYLKSLQGTANKPGLIGAKEFETFKTVTVSFPQDRDLSDRSSNVLDWSFVLNKLDNASNKQYKETIDAGGTLRVYRDANNELIMEAQPVIYNAKTGNMDTIPVQRVEFPFDPKNVSKQQFDYFFQDKINQISLLAQNNNRSQATNKNRNKK